jgi:myo-inositol-1(or 4)-monophosphatase
VRDHDELLAAAHEAADEARRMLRASAAGSVDYKGDRDPVTDVDLAIERAIRDLLRERTPEVAFHGEETSRDELDDAATWVLDPIDGTVNFMHGLPLVAVSLGLVRRGKSEVAVVDLPVLDARYTAARGAGATRDGKPIRASLCSRLSDAVVALGDYATGEDAAARNAPRFQVTADLAAHAQRVRMLGTAAIDLVWVDEGLLDASVMLSNKPWDTAAGVLIAREAGAIVTDSTGQRHTIDSTAVIASAPAVADDLKRLIARSISGKGRA